MSASWVPDILGFLQQFLGSVQLWLSVFQHGGAVWQSRRQALQLFQLLPQGRQAQREFGLQDPVAHLLDLGEGGRRIWTEGIEKNVEGVIEPFV